MLPVPPASAESDPIVQPINPSNEESLSVCADEVTRVRREVGVGGHLGGQVGVTNVGGI
jgi:hypothetical protein